MQQNGQNSLDQYKQQFDKVCAETDARLLKYPVFEKIKEASGIRPAYVALSVIVFVFLFLLFGLGSTALCNLVGFIYPAYASFKALKTETTDDDKQWLTYWVVYAFFTVAESVTDVLMHWIPFYYLAKVLFLCWCFFPQTRGAERLYDVIIEPLISKYEQTIDSFGNGGKTGLANVRDEYKQEISSGVNTMKQKLTTGFATLSKKAAQEIAEGNNNTAPSAPVSPSNAAAAAAAIASNAEKLD